MGDCVEDALDTASESSAGAEEGIAGPTLGPGVHALPVLLVSPSHGDEFGLV